MSCGSWNSGLWDDCTDVVLGELEVLLLSDLFMGVGKLIGSLMDFLLNLSMGSLVDSLMAWLMALLMGSLMDTLMGLLLGLLICSQGLLTGLLLGSLGSAICWVCFCCWHCC